MPDCKGCGNWFGSATKCDLCPICERALERLNGYAVPVVRCKDCKHHTDEHKDMVYCPSVIGDWVADDWYCGDGERKDGDA